MISKELIINAFSHKQPDRTPIFEYLFTSESITNFVLKRPASFLHWEQYVKEIGWENSVRQLAIDRLDIAEFFGHDMLYQVPNQAPTTKITTLPDDNISKTDDPVEIIADRNIKNRECPFQLSEDCLLIYDFLQQEMKKRSIELPIIAPAYKHGVWTNTDLMQTMLLAPQIAHEHFSIATESCEKLINAYFMRQVTLIGIGGDFAGNRPLISPESYRTFIMPELKKLSAIIHRDNAYAVNTSDGNLWNVMEDFLIGTDVDGYLEIDLHAGMDLKKLKERYGCKITFLGNFDCGNTLSFSSPDSIRKAVIQCLEDGMGNGGHIFTASNAITDSVPVENYFAMVNAYREYVNLPPLKY
ncbi:MAG: uroporphyrinogen decarboxylase family protein [Lentisphaerota bacterium]